jgi:translation initiation factor 5B
MQRSGIAYYLMCCTAEVALKESATLEEEPIEVEGDSDDDGSSVDTDDVYDPAWDDDETIDKSKLTVLVRRAKRTERRRRAYEAARAARTPDNVRSPVVVIMGHVDTGKTKVF